MLNAYSSKFNYFIYKSQLLFSLSVSVLFWSLVDLFTEISRALSFYFYDEINYLNHKKDIND